jgi:predicted DNA-binding WGR domain protein
MSEKREFSHQDDKSNKFWTIELVGNACVTSHGRIGAKARETRNEYADETVARREFEKLIASKLKKGYVEGALESVPQYVKPDWSSMQMSDDVFWRIIGLLNWKKLGDDDAVIEPAVAALAQMSSDDIRQFEETLSQKLFALDTEAHAREIGEDAYQNGEHFSVDWFLYVRCVVVANGAKAYATALADPTEMPKDGEFEALLSLAPTAYERKTGSEFEYATTVSYETFSNRKGWPN